MPFGLDFKSILVGIALGFFILPMLMGAVGSKLGSRSTATA